MSRVSLGIGTKVMVLRSPFEWQIGRVDEIEDITVRGPGNYAYALVKSGAWFARRDLQVL